MYIITIDRYNGNLINATININLFDQINVI